MKFLNMQQFSLFLLILLFTASCTKREISSDKLQKRNGIYYAINEDDPYSGIVVEKDEKGQIREKEKYKDGILDGKVERWYSNGQKRSEEEYFKGKPDGIFKIWAENGQKIVETSYKDGKPVYLIRDEKKIEFGRLKDIDGNVYATIKIGNQEWMAENLKVTHYRNGDPIPNVTNKKEWSNLKSGAYCVFENNPTKIETYGLLYNWYAVADNRNIAPKGWHLPTDAEWTTLIIYLGGENVAGGKLKETGTTHWLSPNIGADNSSGFTALPGGGCYKHGNFDNLGNYSRWWSATDGYSSYAYYRFLNFNNAEVSRGSSNKSGGCSVRCVRD